MSEPKRGQLDALLDVELVLPSAETVKERKATPAPRSAPAIPGELAGTQLGKYRVAKLLGTGGMGAVWDARDTELDRRVALKVLRPGVLDDSVGRARLVREARAMARLRHGNVITVFDAESIDGLDIIAMELIDGETMASWLERDHAPGEVLATVLAAGRGLAAAHAAGVIHRDFKPHNVLVDKTGRVVVTDFGLARAVGEQATSGAVAVLEHDADVEATVPAGGPPHEAPRGPVTTLGALDSPLTLTGTMLGTPAYMAPEQLLGEVADERSDQFSFCATAWEALSGQRPFPGASVAEIAANVSAGKPGGGDAIPRRLRGLLARGLAIAPAARWPSIDALLEALARAARRPRRIAIAAGAAVLLAGGALAVHHALQHDTPWQPLIVDLPASEENGDSPAISPDGKQVAFVSDREGGSGFRVYTMPIAGGEPRAITAADGNFQLPRWTRDGKALLITQREKSGFYRMLRQPIDGGPPTDLGTGISADDCGDVLAIADTDRIVATVLLQRPDGTRTVLLRSYQGFFTRVRCDPSGQHIMFTQGKTASLDPVNDVFVTDRAGHELQLTFGHSSSGGGFTADGRGVVFSARRDGATRLYEIPASGGPIEPLTADVGPDLAADVSPDGRVIVFDRAATSSIVQLGGGDAPPRTLSSRREELFSLWATRDGSSLVSVRTREGADEVVVLSTRDGSERTLGPGQRAFLSRDDRRVYFADAGGLHLQVAPIEGGPIMPVVTLPHALISGADADDALHLELDDGAGTQAWRLTHAGKLEQEGMAGLVIPAPSGGWRAVRDFTANARLDRFHFVMPDGQPSPVELSTAAPRPTWLDDHRFAFAANGSLVVFDVRTGQMLETIPGPVSTRGILAADGVHWFDVHIVNHVTRHVLANYGDR